MIGRPKAQDFREAAAIAALRETSEHARGVAEPIGKVGGVFKIAAWLFIMPMAVIPAWFAWRKFWVPAIDKQVDDRRQRGDGFGDTAAMRSELQRSWHDEVSSQ